MFKLQGCRGNIQRLFTLQLFTNKNNNTAITCEAVGRGRRALCTFELVSCSLEGLHFATDFHNHSSAGSRLLDELIAG